MRSSGAKNSLTILALLVCAGAACAESLKG